MEGLFMWSLGNEIVHFITGIGEEIQTLQEYAPIQSVRSAGKSRIDEAVEVCSSLGSVFGVW
jgi:hypothetical protein